MIILYLLIITIILTPGCKNDPAQPEDQNIKLIELYVDEIWNKRNLSLIDSIIGEDFVDPASLSELKGPDCLREVINSYLEAYPDLYITIEEIVADQKKVAWKYIAVGTNNNTGEKTTFNGIIIDRIEKGKIVHRIGVWN